MPDPISSNCERVHILVRGRVQGVGFRAFVQDCGLSLKLTGWVRNVGYDRVESIAEGDHLALERFFAALRTGPRSARVDQADVDWEKATGEYKDFQVTYT